jgi:hypothetical protein
VFAAYGIAERDEVERGISREAGDGLVDEPAHTGSRVEQRHGVDRHAQWRTRLCHGCPSAKRLRSRPIFAVTEEAAEVFARACELLVERFLQFTALHLQLLERQHAEADSDIKGVAHEADGVIPHGITVVTWGIQAPEFSRVPSVSS